MGDDVPDLLVMTACGFSATASDSHFLAQSHALFTSRRCGGRGAVREVCEFILEAQGNARRDACPIPDDGRAMKKWSTAVLPLSILLVLVALTAWLRYSTEGPEPGRDGKNRHDPDIIIGDAKGQKLDASGRLLYTLTAAEIRHYPDDDTTELLKPMLVYLHPTRPPVTISSGSGRSTANGERVDPTEQVEIQRAASAGASNSQPRCPN